jgi:Family of unknown function (DUF6232)
MTTFYPGPYARVTHKVFEVWHPRHRAFALRDVAYAYVVPGTVGAHRDKIRVCSAGSSGLAVLILALARFAGNWPTTASAVVLLAASAMIFGASLAAGRRPHELWGIYQGRPTCLFQTTDERVFGQVSRALLRAIQHRGETLPR